MKMVRVYLDNCCFNRPFDNQNFQIIRLEAEAKLMIQEKIRVSEIELVWSYMLEFENRANPDPEVRAKIAIWQKLAVVNQLESESLILASKNFRRLGLTSPDAIHVAAAIAGGAHFFITTDKGIIKKSSQISEIKIVNPTEFIVSQEDVLL